ncbi:MAG: transcription-repair coupling factor [Zoogloeaceae bacterium]|jgi:transcription-repair coupling factor (superfamily II helicase)|nr:transcription-repair coupling factor [Zoogloeaceae bacterium]
MNASISSLASLFPPPPLPRPGHKVEWQAEVGSADALLLASVAEQRAKSAGILTIVTAHALDARRLQEEIAWFYPAARPHLLPDWETLPYDGFSPHQDLISERLATLWAMMQGTCKVLLVPATTAVARLLPPSFLAAYAFSFAKGEKFDNERFIAQLTLAGYTRVNQVAAPGEFAVRGSLLDLYPMGEPAPFRIDLFDDEIESIRVFDVESQRTLYPVEAVRLLPAREFPLDDAGKATFRRKFRAQFEGDPGKSRVYKEVSAGIASAGIEYFLPLFFEETATLFNYMPSGSVLVTHGDVAGTLETFRQDTATRYDMLRGDATTYGNRLLPPEALFLSHEEFFAQAKEMGRAQIARSVKRLSEPSNPADAADMPNDAPLPVAVDRRSENPLAALKAFLAGFPGRALVVAESAGRRETMAQFFAGCGLVLPVIEDFAAFLADDQKALLTVAPLQAGLRLDARLALISETELYADRPHGRARMRQKSTLDNWLRDLAELKVGDPVVHESHGVGRYMGLTRMNTAEGQVEFLEIHYAEDARLFVPVSQLQVVSRYSGANPENAPLHVLGSGQWEKARKKAAMQARDAAAELLNLYARRAARKGHAFEFGVADIETFAAGFGFEETPDQQEAIEAVLTDMRSEKPMDRLVCGDVGFGKTEVALRAAFAAVEDGKQVAVLCPTTLLCEQHFRTFTDRFADWPVRVAELSRFRSAKESAGILRDLAEGKIDIVLGTHKLLGKEVQFARLGLVVMDEEHRFGVRQKEVLKALRAEVDVLTLTATPIPRTLAMSLEGLRDFSVIATAPQKRLAIKTFVAPSSGGLIREAVLRELKRGGQVYFLHNEVASIETMRARLATLVPEATIAVGHGQMPERELERVMRDFMAQRVNLLLCTTIIETGIDNPHANTILIHRADKFGLAQLHQLRGRVGRSHHQAYAYLLVEEGIGKQARQRLEAIQAMEELGSGFYLAMHDLEIRGAGEVLGEHQSGEMQEVGFNAFMEMLNRAVAVLKAGGAVNAEELSLPSGLSGEIHLSVPALLPDTYCPDVEERLNLYKRLANCERDCEIDAMQEELIDRFGALPPQSQSLLATHRLRLFTRPFGVKKLEATDDRILVSFAPNASDALLDPTRIIALVQKDRRYRFAGQDKLALEGYYPTLEDKVAAIRELLASLQ